MASFVDPIFHHRKSLESDADASNILSTLTVIELNPTELCNRTCVFCPRADPQVYKNRKRFMSLATAERIAEGLAEINFGYRGQISVSGFGEPLLNDDIVEIIAKLRRHLPGVYIELICNGDFLSVELIRSLLNRGVNTILVNLYDGAHQIADFEERFRGIPPARYILRHHYLGAEDSYGLTLNNRTGLVGIRGPLAKPAERACYVPFYKMMIDWNGNHLLCFNDWGRRASVAGNVNEQSIRELWLSPSMEAYRRELLEERRSLTPCNTCDVIGTLHGKASYDAFKEYYE